MEKSIASDGYRKFLELFRETREKSGLTQIELAERIDEGQSFISKCERGERRIDIIELFNFCRAMEIEFDSFVRALHRRLAA